MKQFIPEETVNDELEARKMTILPVPVASCPDHLVTVRAVLVVVVGSSWLARSPLLGPWAAGVRHLGLLLVRGLEATWRMSGQAPGCCRVVMGGTQNTMGGTVHVLAPGE